MIDWYIQPPFFAPGTKAAQASLAELINGDSKHAIVQAPHHFELWQVGYIEENTGELIAAKDFICDCASLIRTGVRERAAEDERNRTPGSPAGGRQSAPEVPTAHTGANAGTAQG